MATKTRFRSSTHRGPAVENQLRTASPATQFRGKARTRYFRERRYEAASLIALHLHETPMLQFQPEVAAFQRAKAVSDHESSTVLHEAFCRFQDGTGAWASREIGRAHV